MAQQVAAEAAMEGARSLLHHLSPSDREKAVKKSVELFVEEFVRELTDASPLSAAIPGYRGQLKTLIESAAPFITAHLRPEVPKVDLGPIQRQWTGDRLPEDFSWQRLAMNFERALKKLVRTDSTLQNQLAVALAERAAGPAPGFDLPAYREFLRGKCGALQLGAMHSSSYDLRLTLWNVFVPPSARESVAVRELPHALRQRLRQEGHLRNDAAEDKAEQRREFEELRQRWQSGTVTPVLGLLERERFLVILGDPGSGKSSLLKYRALQWANGGADDGAPLPLWVDLRDFAASGKTLLDYLHNAPGGFRLDFRDIENRLQEGTAAVYFDGLDEIFDPDLRHRVVEEIAALAAQYRPARAVVTSRIIGYEAERLRDAGFAHATLEDFDDEQAEAFLDKWHAVAEPGAAERNRLQEQLSAALRDSRAIRDLAGNPLLLTMMAPLNRNQDLPRDRVELYREASRVLLQEWETRKAIPVDTFGRQEKETLLRRLAGEMQQGDSGLAGNLVSRGRLTSLIREYLKELGAGKVYERAKELVRQLEERNFILCYGGADSFSFVHRTFLEYFCAAWFVDQIQVQQTLTIDSLKTDVFGRHWRDESWHEVLRLITGMLGESHAHDLIRFLMELDGSEDELGNLMLAAGCLSEVRNRAALSKTDAALKKRFLTEVVRYDRPYYYDDYFVWQEAGRPRSSGVRWLAYSWRNQETFAWLKSAAKGDEDWIVRQAAVQELARGFKADPETLPWLKDRARSDENWDVRKAAVQELARGFKADPETLPLLKDRARSDENWAVRQAAVQELARGFKADPETLPLLKACIASAPAGTPSWELDGLNHLLRSGWPNEAG